MHGVILILILAIMGGAIAYIGDKLGSKVGKKKLTMFGLRPKHTSIIVTIITGILITTSTLIILSISSQNVRTALFGLDELNKKIAQSSKDLIELNQDLNKINTELIKAKDDKVKIVAELISVIVPCYNQAQYLDECLQSVLEQTYPNWECIIVNDGSPDNTEEVAKLWIEKDKRFKYFWKENSNSDTNCHRNKNPKG